MGSDADIRGRLVERLKQEPPELRDRLGETCMVYSSLYPGFYREVVSWALDLNILDLLEYEQVERFYTRKRREARAPEEEAAMRKKIMVDNLAVWCEQAEVPEDQQASMLETVLNDPDYWPLFQTGVPTFPKELLSLPRRCTKIITNLRKNVVNLHRVVEFVQADFKQYTPEISEAQEPGKIRLTCDKNKKQVDLKDLNGLRLGNELPVVDVKDRIKSGPGYMSLGLMVAYVYRCVVKFYGHPMPHIEVVIDSQHSATTDIEVIIRFPHFLIRIPIEIKSFPSTSQGSTNKNYNYIRKKLAAGKRMIAMVRSGDYIQYCVLALEAENSPTFLPLTAVEQGSLLDKASQLNDDRTNTDIQSGLYSFVDLNSTGFERLVNEAILDLDEFGLVPGDAFDGETSLDSQTVEIRNVVSNEVAEVRTASGEKAWLKWSSREVEVRRLLCCEDVVQVRHVKVEGDRALLLADAGVSARNLRLSPEEVYEMSRQLYYRLQHVYKQHKVNHNDVALRNICKKGATYTLIDWGLASFPGCSSVSCVVRDWEVSPSTCFRGTMPDATSDLESLVYTCLKALGASLPWSGCRELAKVLKLRADFKRSGLDKVPLYRGLIDTYLAMEI